MRRLLLSAMVIVTLACAGKPPSPDEELNIQIDLTDRFNEKLIAGMRIVLDSVPGQAELLLAPMNPVSKVHNGQ